MMVRDCCRLRLEKVRNEGRDVYSVSNVEEETVVVFLLFSLVYSRISLFLLNNDLLINTIFERIKVRDKQNILKIYFN